MSREFTLYKASVDQVRNRSGCGATNWQFLYDWYTNTGRQQFIDAFEKETSTTVPLSTGHGWRVENALPKSVSDLNAKATRPEFYRAHAVWFIEEFDEIIRKVPRDIHCVDAWAVGTTMRLINNLLLDSLVLFEDWGTYCAGVPGVYRVYSNPREHVMHVFQGAAQIIYGHGAYGLSFAENHSDTCIGLIRQALELRIRRGFGVVGRESISNGVLAPIPLSDVLEAINNHKQAVTFQTSSGTPVPFENIIRIYGWANLYMHDGLKLYSWVAARALEYVRFFVLGGSASNGSMTMSAGIQLEMTDFDAIRQDIEALSNPSKYKLIILPHDQCEVVFV